MAGMTDLLEDKILNATLRGQVYTGPGQIYVGLLTSNPGESGQGTEVADANYSRQPVTFAAPVNSQVTNTNIQDFQPLATNFGTVTHLGLYDRATAGEMLYYAALDSPVTYNDTTGIRISVGDLKVSLD